MGQKILKIAIVLPAQITLKNAIIRGTVIQGTQVTIKKSYRKKTRRKNNLGLNQNNIFARFDSDDFKTISALRFKLILDFKKDAIKFF